MSGLNGCCSGYNRAPIEYWQTTVNGVYLGYLLR